MYRDLTYTSLADLVLDFERAYNEVFHTLLCVRISQVIPHEGHSVHPIAWRHLLIQTRRVPADEIKKALDRYGKDIKTKLYASREPLMLLGPGRVPKKKRHVARSKGGKKQPAGTPGRFAVKV